MVNVSEGLGDVVCRSNRMLRDAEVAFGSDLGEVWLLEIR